MIIDVETAVSLIERSFIKLKPQKKPLHALEGKVLAQPIQAVREQPPFDRVAMDGIAINYGDFSNKTFPISIVGIQKAGSPPLKLENFNNAFEVMTGAVLPEGTDTVIPYEDITIESGFARLNQGVKVKKKQNIHFRGNDFKRGEILLEVGTKLSSVSVSLIAGAGSSEAVVWGSPRIAIVSTGDELVDPGKNCEAWQIWRSNPYGVQAGFVSLGLSKDDISFYNIGDDEEDVFSLFSKIVDSYDILIISGGISKGKFDYVPKVMDKLGIKKIFHGIKQKPGKPMFFGVGSKGQNIFGLPGNPVSALICFRRYVVNELEKSWGQKSKNFYAVLSEDIVYNKSLCLFKEVFITCKKDGVLVATPIPSNGSGDFSGLGKSDGFLQLPAGKSIYKAGDAYPFFSWRGERI